jgi:hypothetical protein
MAQFSVKIIRLNGAVLDENQHYIDGLEREIIKARTGVDFSSLLSD